ncbi:MAG: GHKL domain-containing protein [Sedimentibacter sp.]
MIDLYEITYAITNIFGAYIIYKLMRVFFDELCTSKKTEIFSYITYYFISSLTFFIARVPIVMMSVNIFLFFCLTLNYQSTFKKRIISAILAYMILMCVEVLVAAFTGYFAIPVFEHTSYDSAIGMLLIRVVSLLIVTVLTNLKNIKNDIPVPNFYWFSTIFISSASLYQFIILLAQGNFSQFKVITLIITILGTNFVVLFLYDNLYKSFATKTEEILLQQQNKAYEKQFELMQQSLDDVQVVRHDMKNHMITLKNLYLNNETISASEYIDDIIFSVDAKKKYSNSENFIIDSILNYKLQAIRDMDIEPEVEINVPQKISISSYDMTVILGNLLDNAITALKKCTDVKKFSVKINYNKDNILITISNSFSEIIKEKNGSFETLKDDTKNHGFGLKSVKDVVNRNDGHMSVHYDNKIFKVTILLPV